MVWQLSQLSTSYSSVAAARLSCLLSFAYASCYVFLVLNSCIFKEPEMSLKSSAQLAVASMGVKHRQQKTGNFHLLKSRLISPSHSRRQK